MKPSDRLIDVAAARASVERRAAQTDARTLDSARGRALDRADRREWAERKFAVGGEFRWQETVSEPKQHGRRRFVYDPISDRVVEIS
jgi:hypothetical protein